MLQFLSRWSNKHVSHEKCMISPGADDSDIDSVFLVPAGESIDDINAVASIQVINSPFSIDFPDL